MADFNRELLNETRDLPRDVEDLAELTRKAVSAFRQMLPALNSYVRALTGDRSVSVKMHAKLNGATDGRDIYMRPPLALGRDVTHVRSLCDKRDPETLKQRCPSCRRLEEILIVIYHEVAHIAFGTFFKATTHERRRFLEEVVRQHDDAFGKAVLSRIQTAPYEIRYEWQALCNLVDERFGLLFNAVEDCRVNIQMFSARPGTHPMMTAKALTIFNEGVEQVDPETGQPTVVMWRDYPLDAQAAVAICAASMRITGDYFHPKVTAMLEDAVIKRCILSITRLRSAEGAVQVSFRLLARLRELGFMLRPEELPQPQDPDPGEDDDETPENPEDQESGDEEGSGSDNEDPADSGEPGDESGSDSGSDSGVASDDESESGDPDGEPSPSDGDDGDDTESAESGDASGGSESGDAGEPDMGGDPGGDHQDPDDSSGRSGSDVSDDASADDGGDPDTGSSTDDTGIRDRRSSESQSSDQNEMAGDEAGSSAGGPGLPSSGDEDAAGQDHGESGTLDASEGGTSDGTSGTGDGDGSSERPSGDDIHSDLSGSDGNGGGSGSSGDEADADGGESSEAGPVEGGAPDDVATGTEEAQESSEDEDGEVLDPGRHEGPGVKVVTQEDPEKEPSLPDPPHGSADDIRTVLIKLGDHDIPDEVTASPFFEEKVEEEVHRALVQSVYFEQPSRNIRGVTYVPYGPQGWMTGRAQSNERRRLGIDGDYETPRTVLGPALMRMRRIFSDNRLAARFTGQRTGRVDSRALGKRAWQDDDRLFTRKLKPGAKDYFVLIGIDVSFSTAGVNLQIAKRAAMAQAELCQRIGVDFAVYAHTGGHVTDPMTNTKGFDLVLFEVKTRKQVWDKDARKRLADLGPFSANIDGHTLEQYRKICDELPPATQCIIMYYTDGAMPAENYAEELEILVREIGICKQRGYALMGVGIRTDSPTRHGLDTVQLDSVEDTVKVVRHLEKKMASRAEVRR